MKYLDMSVRDCQDIRHLLIDIQMMLDGKDLSFSDDFLCMRGLSLMPHSESFYRFLSIYLKLPGALTNWKMSFAVKTERSLHHD